MKHYQGYAQWVILIVLCVCVIFNMGKTHISVATFDKRAVIAHFIGQLSQHTLTDELITQKTAQFNYALTVSLNEYATSKHTTVLDKAYVLATARDATEEIMKLVAEHMRDTKTIPSTGDIRDTKTIPSTDLMREKI